jgi:MYXO-CTERM domain-containing protein
MRTQPLLQGLILGASLVALWPAAAQARPEYPGAIQEAANMDCVPTCLLCHVVTPGTSSTWQQKPVGNALIGHNLEPGNEDSVQGAWNGIVADSADPTKMCGSVTCATMVATVPKGIEPSTMSNVCGPTYGCGATIAQRPLSEAKHYNDPAPAIAAALTLLGGFFALRRRRPR